MIDDFWNFYNRKTVISVTEISDPLETEEKLRLLHLFCDDLIDPDMYGLMVSPEIEQRVRELRQRCWGVPADPLQGVNQDSEGVPKPKQQTAQKL